MHPAGVGEPLRPRGDLRRLAHPHVQRQTNEGIRGKLVEKDLQVLQDADHNGSKGNCSPAPNWS